MDLNDYVRPKRDKKKALHSQERSAASAELTGEALRLLVKLDARVPLCELPAKFPRVLNRIAAVWSLRSEADRYFDELLMDTRGARQGFPLSVISELTALRHFYVTREFPKQTDPWEQMHLR